MIFCRQVVDAVTTPIAGIYSDKSRGFPRYGKRKSWHAIGEFKKSVIGWIISYKAHSFRHGGKQKTN